MKHWNIIRVSVTKPRQELHRMIILLYNENILFTSNYTYTVTGIIARDKEEKQKREEDDEDEIGNH